MSKFGIISGSSKARCKPSLISFANDILNFSHLNYGFKNSEILKDSGIEKKKSLKNIIKIQLNNISISHNVIKKKINSKDKDKIENKNRCSDLK